MLAFRFDSPPTLSAQLRLLAINWLRASKFLRFLAYGSSGFTMSCMEVADAASAKLVKDFDLPL